jgi:methylmalonyl-CoA epimerase
VAARQIHHVGFAVPDLDAAVETYRDLFGAELEHRAHVQDQGVEAAAVRVGDSRVELVEPLADDTPVGRFLARRGPGMHHIAYRVDDVRTELARLGEAGVHLIDTEPHTGLFGLQVAFLHPDAVYGVLTELVTDG